MSVHYSHLIVTIQSVSSRKYWPNIQEAAKSFTNALLLCENLPTSTSTSPTSTISANSSLTVLEPNSAELDSATQLNYLRGNRARVMTLLGDYPAAIADYKAMCVSEIPHCLFIHSPLITAHICWDCSYLSIFVLCYYFSYLFMFVNIC